MIEITDGFTCISAGSDRIEDQAESARRRSATGARVVIEFRRKMPLAAGQRVTARYDFAGDGNLREGMGIALPIGAVVRWGRTVQYHYRFSYWIPACGLMDFAGRKLRSRASLPAPDLASAVQAIDLTPA